MSEMCFDDFDYDRHSDSCECSECTPENLESQTTDTQQLKAKIASFAESLDISKEGHFTKDFIVSKLRQLSAV